MSDSMWSTVLQAGSVFIAAVSVVIGVTTWRRSRIGERRIELAEDAVDLFGQAVIAIGNIRSPFGFVGEGASRKSRADEEATEKEILDRAYVVFERHERYADLFSKLFSLQRRYEFYFGSEAGAPFDELAKIRNEIFGASRALSRLWLRQGRVEMSAEEFDRHLKEMRAAEAVFWEGADEPDLISTRSEAALAAVSQTCKAVIGGHPNIWTWLKSCWHFLRRFLSLTSSPP